MQNVNGLLNTENPSIISKERRAEINQVATRAFNARNIKATENDDFINNLKSDYYSLSDVLGSITSATPQLRFYKDIDKAFGLLIKTDPEAFATYQALTGMFRTIEKESKVIDDVSSDMEGIIHDIDLLETESFKKG
ncbi:hypothetical protein ADIARSV_0156 [Arcticibacter svalbardensis MN12-7]|uniref:Uncharacterized protein n=1 Tax=Arcticibacter svalbardensis MN12-7 TaxID=1150600 RepID=R9GYK8_9SPHI|nr:hypothetical protein [Arcticibacter svalbardensis]EOR96733.1 hypothetical protein ADIARSV_0156 [Arcticibacter svalbardensis MN12-7]